MVAAISVLGSAAAGGVMIAATWGVASAARGDASPTRGMTSAFWARGVVVDCARGIIVTSARGKVVASPCGVTAAASMRR